MQSRAFRDKHHSQDFYLFFAESWTFLTILVMHCCRENVQRWISSSLHSKHSALSATHVRGPRCNSVIEYTACSSVWIMGVHLLHNHWYRINRHTNQGQRVLGGSIHCPSVILASGGRQPQPSWGVVSSIKSLWHRERNAEAFGVPPISKNNLEGVMEHVD